MMEEVHPLIEQLCRAGWTLAEALENEPDLSAVSRAVTREAAIRSVMKIRQVDREQAAKIVDGSKL